MVTFIHHIALIVSRRIKHSSLLQGFLSTTIWGGLSKLLTLLVTFYCSNILTKEGFGEYSFVRNTLNMILVICATNFASLATKFATESLQSEVSIKRLYILIEFIVGFSCICGIFIICIPFNVIQSFTAGESVAYFVKIMGVLLPIFIIQPIVVSIFRGYKQFNRIGIYETCTAIFFLLITILCVNLWDYRGAIYAILIYYAINSISGMVLLCQYNHRNHYIRCVKKKHSDYNVIWTMIIPVFFMSFIEVPLTWIAQAEMGRRASYAMVGGLSVILSIRYILQILPTYFYQAFIPHATQLFTMQKHTEYFFKYRQITIALATILIIAMPLLIIFGKFLLGLYGTIYVDLYPSFIIGLIITIILLYCTLFKTNLIIREHQQLILLMTVISSVIFISVFYCLINLHINILDSYLLAQGAQFGVQLMISMVSYYKDVKCLFKN